MVQVDLQSEPISIHYEKMIALVQLLDARDASLVHAIALARDLVAELERYEALGGEIGVRCTAVIGGELSAERARAAIG